MAVTTETLHGTNGSVPETESLPFPLRIARRSVDIDLDLERLDELARFSKGYENACFRRVAEELGQGEVAYGAHLLNTAFNTHHKGGGISIPDALVGEIDYSMQVLDQSGNPPNRPVIKVKRIIEARTGNIHANGKIAGFKNLTKALRNNPGYFTKGIRALLGERGGVVNPGLLTAAEDSEIEIIFYSPREQPEEDEEARQRLLKENPFRRVRYETVPLPEYQLSFGLLS